MSVTLRKIQTALQREYRKAGGIRVQDAVDRAQANLGELTENAAARIDEIMERLSDMTNEPNFAPDVTALHQLHALVNELLGCCAVVEIPGFVDTLYAVGRLIGALVAANAPVEGALAPAVNLLRFVRRESVDPDDLRVLIDGVDKCSTRIRSQSQKLNS